MTVSDSASIHPTAIIADGATVGADVEIGPYSIVGERVTIGAGTKVDGHAVLSGNTEIGEANRIFPFASVGGEPQDLKYSGEDSKLVIGNKNIIREYVTLQPGTTGGGLLTKIGDQNLFMANTHVGHDSIVGDGNIFANSAALSGHVIVGNRVIVGGLCGIHQFTRLGDFSFLGGGAMVVKDIPPFCLAQGDRAELYGLNLVGLKRGSFSPEDMRALKNSYRGLFFGTGKFRERIELVKKEYGESEHVSQLIEFVESSERGIASASRDTSSASE